MKGKQAFTRCFQVAVLAIFLTSVMGCSSKTTTASPGSTTASNTYTVNLSTKTGIGDYLVDSKGMTLYWTALDLVGQSNVSGSALSIWPVFYISAVTIPSSLNAADFSSITRADGKMQTTYKGWPIYYYYQDLSSGNTYGQGVDGVWFAAGPTSSGPTTSTTTSSGY